MKRKVIILGILTLLLLTGCGKKESNTQKEVKKNEETKKVQIVDEQSNSRPYGVIINNYPGAIKVHSGLDKAYIVYEFPIEGGISRSLALFKDVEDVKVGTVRSARQYHIDYALENDAIFVHFGWNHPAQDKEKNLGIDYIDGNTRDGSIFHRENPEKLATEHTVYTNLKDVISYANNNRHYRTTTDVKQPFTYSADEINLNNYNDAIVANNVRVTYSNSFYVDFKYDEAQKKYLRSYMGTPHTDYFTKQQYATKNIIITLVGIGSVNGYKDAAGTNYLDINNIGEGTGYYITNGYARKIKWSKKDNSSQTVYTYEDGTKINVNDGNTWIMFQDANITPNIN